MLNAESIFLSLITALFVGGVAGYLGSFMVLRKMALVGDAMSHVALPGIGLALLWNFNPFLGGFLFLAFATVLIWWLEYKTTLSEETLVGVMFTASLAIGVLITPDHELLEALFGDISQVDFVNTLLAVVLSIIVFLVAFKIKDGYLLGTISKDLAKSNGVKIAKIDLVYLFLVSLIVALGIKVAGTLLTGALVVLPAAASKNLSSSFNRFSGLSLIFGMISAFGGIVASSYFGLVHAGPAIVLSCSVIFLISLFVKK